MLENNAHSLLLDLDCLAGLSARASAAMEKVSFGTSGATGYEAGPKGNPAVVVLQEWWGERALQ